MVCTFCVHYTQDTCSVVGVQDFVSAVMDVDYSPTGREFVAGSYDRWAGGTMLG